MNLLFCVQGVSDSPSEDCQNGMEGRSESLQVKLPSSKRLYNWNTTHFYPDVHKLDNDELSLSRQRRHSEPHCFLRSTDNVSSDQQSSGSVSSLASFDEVRDRQDTTMPVSQLTVQLSAPHTAYSPVAKVDVDLDSGSESEDDAPKIWHRSPLHVRRGRRCGVGGRSGKKPGMSVSAHAAGELWKEAADRPSVRLKEQAEKRRKFLQQRCQMYGWDLTSDQEKQSIENRHKEERRQYAASQSQEDVYFIDDSPESYCAQYQNGIEHSSATAAENSGRLVDVNNIDKSLPRSMPVNVSVKESSSFENIYDTVSLEPDMSSDDVEVVQLYEPRQAKVDAVYCHTEPLMSNKLPHADLQPSVRSEIYKPNDSKINPFCLANIANTSMSVAACNVSASRPSSAPSKSMQKANLDAKSIVEEEKLKFVEYKIEYRRQHSSGSEHGSGKSDGEKDTRRQQEPASKSHKTIPPDDYEYILRKIHYNRPQNKTDQKPAASLPYTTNRGSELHIEIKKPQTTTRHITVDVAKPSVPHRMESLQHTGLVHQLPARPDVIPSPNYPPNPNMIARDFRDGGDTGKDLNVCPGRPSRTVLRSEHPSVSTRPSALPTHDDSSVCQWTSGNRIPEREHISCSEPQYAGAASDNSQNREPSRKPPKPPREDLPQNRSPDYWNYNTTYEPSSPSSQPQLSQSMTGKERKMWHTSKTEPKDSAKPHVHDLVRCLDENAELTPKAAAVFHEQYRWSIHEPPRLAKPDQLKHSQQSQLPCSQVFASSVCVPSEPVQLVGKINEPSSKHSGGVCNRKEKVFSVTGYHKPPQVNAKCLTQNIHVKAGQMYPGYSDIRGSYSGDSVMEPEPLYWYSEADKRKPIVNSPEVETALNRDCQQRYFYCSGQVDSQNLMLENSRNMRQRTDNVVSGWKGDLCHRENYAERSVHKDVRLLGQKSQDRLVQQMSLGRQEVTGQLHSNSSYCRSSFPVLSNSHVHDSSDHIHTDKSSTSRLCRQPPAEVGQHKDIESLKTCDHVPSRGSTDYEKHVFRGQESYRSQVMAQIEPSAVTGMHTVQDNSLRAKNSQNMTRIITSHDAPKGWNSGRTADFEVKDDVGTLSDRFVHKAHSKKFVEACPANQGRREIDEDEDSYPVSVAEIKAKLFGPSEDGARKLLRQQSDVAKGSQTGTGGGGTLHECVGYPSSEQKKPSFTSDGLADFERLVDRLDKGDMPLENQSKWCSISPSVSSTQCSSADDHTVKRLSITNIKMLEGSRGKQSPSLEYAKEWLVSGRRASASVINDKSSEHIQSSNASEGNAVKSTAHVPATENVSFVSHNSTKSLPCTKPGDVCRPVAVSNVSSSGINVVTKSHVHAPRSTPEEGSVAFRSGPAGQLSSICCSSSNSFARRSLPALTEKDAERWRNMVSRIQENENRREAKSRSVERLSQPHCEMPSASAVNLQTTVGMLATASHNAECNLAVTAQPSLHYTPDMVPADPASLKPKRQQTPRDVKCRDESRMKGIRASHTNADSGYLDSGSDSHGSSSTDVPKRLPSESNESDELELQRYTCDEDDEIKLNSGSLYVSNRDSAFSMADKSDTCDVSLSDYKVSTESPESRAKQLQTLREDWFNQDIHRPHSSSLSDKSDSSNALKLQNLNKDFGFEYSESSKFGRSVPLSLGLPNGKPAKPLYVSPLVQTSSCGMHRTPVSRSCDDRSYAAADTQLSSPSKITTFKMMFPSQGPEQNTGSGSKSTVTPQSAKVTHIPVRAVGFHSGQSPTRCSAFSPYVEHKDLQINRTDVGGTNITETKKELVQLEPQQYKASRILERTVDQPSLKTYQRESEQFKHERQEIKEPNVKITRQVTDSKIERTYRIENYPQPKAPQLTVRSELDKCETSDGEMTDATDVTLDVMVGANQSLTPTVGAGDFSDVEFLSSANLPAKYDTSFIKGSAKPCVSHPCNKNFADAHRIRSDDGHRNAAIAAANAEIERCKKNKKDVKTDEGEPPVERRRSIKELVHSFEDMTSPFLRTRPRSMEIRISSSSEDGNQDDNVTGRSHKNIKLRASSSFKEASRLDRRNRQEATMNQ